MIEEHEESAYLESIWLGARPRLYREQAQNTQVTNAESNYRMTQPMMGSHSTTNTLSLDDIGQEQGGPMFPVTGNSSSTATNTNTPYNSHPPTLSSFTTLSVSTDGQAAQSGVPYDSLPGGTPTGIDHSVVPPIYDNHPVPPGLPTQISLEDLPNLTTAPPNLTMELDTLYQTVTEMIARNPGRQQRLQIVQCARNIHELAENGVSCRSTSKKVPNWDRPFWRCPDCGFESDNKNVFKRHSMNTHFPMAEYSCPKPGCPFKTHRKDKVYSHHNERHHENAPEDEIERLKTSFLHPLMCPCCTSTIQSWDQFWVCYLKDCRVDPTSSDASSEGNSDDPGDDSRQPGFDGDGSHMGGCDAKGPSPSMHGHNVPHNDMGNVPRQFLPGANSQQMNDGQAVIPRTQPRPNPRAPRVSTMASQPRRVNARPSPVPAPRHTNSHHIARGGIHRQRTRRSLGRRPRGQVHSSHQKACHKCRHNVHDCQDCRNDPPTMHGCHNCRHAPAPAAVQADGPPAERSVVGTGPVSQAVDYINPALLGGEAHDGQIHFDRTIPPTTSTDFEVRERMEDQQERGYQEYMTSRSGHHLYQIRALPQVLMRGMSEIEMESSALDLKTRSQAGTVEKIKPGLVALPFRIPVPRPRRPLPDATTMPCGEMEPITRQVFGPPSLSKFDLSSGCQCSCRTKSQGTHFGRGRVDIAPGRKVEMNFKMMPGERAAGHPLRTRIQVVVKVLRLRTAAAKSTSDKHKKEAHAALKEALESTLEGSETTSKEEARIVDLDDTVDDSDVESIADSTFSVCSRSSSYSDLALLSPPRPSSPAFPCSRRSSCTDLSVPSPRPSPLSQWEWEEDSLSSEDEPVREVELLKGEENELEFKFDLDLEASLNKLSRWTGVPTDDLCSDISVWDPERVFQYLMKYLLFVIFSLARSRDHDPNLCWDKKPSSQF